MRPGSTVLSVEFLTPKICPWKDRKIGFCVQTTKFKLHLLQIRYPMPVYVLGSSHPGLRQESDCFAFYTPVHERGYGQYAYEKLWIQAGVYCCKKGLLAYVMHSVHFTCWIISGCDSRILKHGGCSPIPEAFFFLLLESVLNKCVTMKSSVPQHPVQTIISTETRKLQQSETPDAKHEDTVKFR